MTRLSFDLFALAFSFAAPAAAEVDIDELIAEAGLREGPVAMRDLEGWQPPGKIIVLDRFDLGMESVLQGDGIEIVSVGSVAEAIDAVADADAMIGYCSNDVVSAGKKLRWVQVGSAGVERCLATPALADGSLSVGTCKRDITPVSPELADQYEAAFGAPAAVNHTDPIFLAGFGNNREATGYNDRLWARGMVLERQNLRIAIVAKNASQLDLVNY